MTPQQREEVSRYLEAFDFSGLFTDPAIGWNWPDSGQPLRVPFQNDFIALDHVAEKKGVRILLVPPLSNGSIMPSDERKKLEKAVTPLVAEHLLIFMDEAKTRQVWQWTSRIPGKPVRHRELTWEKGRANELLLQKLTSIAFTLDEEEGLDITGVVQRLRDNLDRDKLTKKFYNEFKRHKDDFQSFVDGISDAGILAHYTSLMLNRLMFCYFLQQKGHLNGEQDYLRNRYGRVRELLGEDQFHSFYRTFLKRLFHEGLDGEERPAELTELIGKNIPYLNGGIFAEHPIERGYPDIQIPDEAFEKIFDFFDSYHWHLDDRPLGNDQEINPEVLGYVFEKYTNQKEMGAYYTKEDITEYISKNTILPFLLRKVGSKIPDDAWRLLRDDPDRYIYEAVRRGAGPDEESWRESLPEEIAVGLDTTAPDLIERRKHWNQTTPESHKLPTEIWRETIARHQRCHELRRKLRDGEVTCSEDLITLNLDIRQFVQDVVSSAPADLAHALWKALRGVTVLDPTCGSGAFLFAALEILQPLYEGLLERFRALLTDWQATGEKHPNWVAKFGEILGAVELHPNEDYFVHKTLIVHNLYGVDIMEEAVEICKLRLFLKLAAQLEPGQEIEPLPDIDFNVRAGNTLVGYATRQEIEDAVRTDTSVVAQTDGRRQEMLPGITDDEELFRDIMERAENANLAFEQFQNQQDEMGQSASSFREAKEELEERLSSLRDQLDRLLAGQYHQSNVKTDTAFEKWRESHQPFHWYVEFFGIMNSGGFNVIVGNPPYVENKAVTLYGIRNYSCLEAGNLYALVMERSFSICDAVAAQGFIVPVSSISTDRYDPIRELVLTRECWLSSFDDRPSRLFDGLEHIRLTVHLIGTKTSKYKIHTTRYNKWNSDERDHLFQVVRYANSKSCIVSGAIPKVSSEVELSIISNLEKIGGRVELVTKKGGGHRVFYSRKVGYFLQVVDFEPTVLDGSGRKRPPSEFKELEFSSREESDVVLTLLNSNLFFWFITIYSDCRHLNKREVNAMPISIERFRSADVASGMAGIAPILMDSLQMNSDQRVMKFKHDTLTIQCLLPKYSKEIIDRIDYLLAIAFGFTEVELDFIINYDIKYRMGLS